MSRFKQFRLAVCAAAALLCASSGATYAGTVEVLPTALGTIIDGRTADGCFFAPLDGLGGRIISTPSFPAIGDYRFASVYDQFSNTEWQGI